MKFCAARKPGIYRRVGSACGLDVVKATDREADHSTIDFITGFLAALGMNTRLREHGVREDHLEALVAQAWDDPCHKTNVVPVSVADIRTLYLEVM
jgi:alcohol dehydrogenase class IV